MKLFLILLLQSSALLIAQDGSNSWDYQKVKSQYDWDILSYREKVDALQVPENVLLNMTTEEVVEVCLTYPLFGVITSFNNMQNGFNKISVEFNGFQELFKRKDAGLVLLKRYRVMDPKGYNKEWSALKIGEYGAEFFYIEFLLAQNSIINSLNRNEKINLLGECVKKAEAKANQSLYSTMFGITTEYIMEQVLLNAEEIQRMDEVKQKNQQSDFFVRTLVIKDKEYLSTIHSCAKEFINENK